MDIDGTKRATKVAEIGTTAIILYVIVCCLACIPTWTHLTQCGAVYADLKEGKTVVDAAIRRCGGHEVICNDLSSNSKCTPLSEANRQTLSTNTGSWFDFVETKLKFRVDASKNLE